MSYRLEWTFYFIDHPVVGQSEGSKEHVIDRMFTDVRDALQAAGRWHVTHDMTIRSICSALRGYMDTDDPVLIRSKAVAITLTYLPDA